MNRIRHRKEKHWKNDFHKTISLLIQRSYKIKNSDAIGKKRYTSIGIKYSGTAILQYGNQNKKVIHPSR